MKGQTNQRTLDEHLRLWYDQFASQHETLRDELIEELDRRGLVSRANGPLRQLNLDLNQNHEQQRADVLRYLMTKGQKKTRGQVPWLPWGVAAAILMVLVGGLITASVVGGKPAYAMPDSMSSLREAKSLYVRARTISLQSGEEFPVEVYVSWPNTFWTSKVVTRRIAGMAVSEQQITLSNGRVRCQVAGTEDGRLEHDLPVLAQIEINHTLTATGLSDLIVADPAGFRHVGRERSHGVLCDVFERLRTDNGRVHRVYVNPQSRKPVRAIGYVVGDEGERRVCWEVGSITIDPLAAPDHIQFEHLEAGLELLPTSPVLSRFPRGKLLLEQRITASVPFAMRVESALLVCFASGSDHNSFSELPLELVLVDSSGSDVETKVHSLGHTRDNSQVRWEWLRVEPTSPRSTRPLHAISVRYPANNGRENRREMIPVDLEPTRLGELIDFMSSDGDQFSLRDALRS